jgi:Domain of unknown function (DUF4138)
MKKLLVILLLNCLQSSLFSQNSLESFGSSLVDTIWVGRESTVYVILPELISLFDIGNKDYVGKIENGSIIFLKATNPFAKPSTMLIQYGNTIFKGYVAFREKIEKPFYDFRALPKMDTDSKLKADKSPKLSLGRLKEASSNISLKEKNSDVIVKLVNIFNDKEATYLKFEVSNESTIIYQVDYVSFIYKTHVKRKKRNQLTPQQQEVEPLEFEAPMMIGAGGMESFMYAIPLYSATENDYLEIVFREGKGARLITMNIPAKKILTANLL